MNFSIETILLAASRNQPLDYNDIVFKIFISGNLVFDNVETASTIFKLMSKGGALKVLLELQNLENIDSSGIGAIMNFAKTLRSRHGNIALLHVSSKVDEVFDLVNLQRFIQSYNSNEEALAFLK